jgi:uncharacterized protein YciU (UPF0263 family)
MTDTFGDTHPNNMSPADMLLFKLQDENMRLEAQVRDLEADKRLLAAQVLDAKRLANEDWETKHIFGFAMRTA